MTQFSKLIQIPNPGLPTPLVEGEVTPIQEVGEAVVALLRMDLQFRCLHH